MSYSIPYRRKMQRKHYAKRWQILRRSGYKPALGKGNWEIAEGNLQLTEKHIKYPKNSHRQRDLKRLSNKIIRRRNEALQGNGYRRCFDYHWTLY